MYVPDRIVTNDDLSKEIETTDKWIQERTGIKERRIAGADDYSSTMGAAAALEALECAKLPPKDIDLIIVATSSPDYLTPPVSSQIQDLIGAPHIGAFTMVVGCSGFVYALATAQQFISSGSYNRVLVVGVELISRYLNWKDRNTCVLFGDGAGAFVLEASEEKSGVLSFVLGSDGSGHEHLILKSGGVRIPPSHESIDKKENYLDMNGPEVFRFATKIMGQAFKEVLEKANMTADDIDLFIPHQANVRIIETAAKFVGLPMEKVFVNLDRYGNTSAASVPIAFCEAYAAGRMKPGNNLAFVAFGAGLSWAGSIVKII